MSQEIKEVLLSKEESGTLKKRLIAVVIFLVFAVAIFAVFVSVADFKWDDRFSYILPVFGIFFFGIIFYIASGSIRDLYHGRKQIIVGKVTNKERFKSRSRGKRSGSSRPRYYLFLNGKKYFVEQEHYNQVYVGEIIELHYAKHSNLSFKVVTLSDRGERVKPEPEQTIRERLEEYKESYKSIPKAETKMSHEDFRELKKHRNQKIRFDLTFVIMALFMALCFSVGALLWWVMAIPLAFLIIVFLFFTRKVIRTLKLYREEKLYGVKMVALTEVLDKQYHSGSGRSWWITTGLGTFKVSSEVYQSVNAQQPVLVSTGKMSGWLLELKVE